MGSPGWYPGSRAVGVVRLSVAVQYRWSPSLNGRVVAAHAVLMLPTKQRTPVVPMVTVSAMTVLVCTAGRVSDLQAAATRAARGRAVVDPHFGPHPRQGVPVGHDDLVAQLTFGNLVHLLPNDPPTQQSRQRFASGYSRHEQLWINATSNAFPNLSMVWQNRRWSRFPTVQPVPAAVEQGYALAAALERLRRVRNRVGHHEQMFRVRHNHRHTDAMLIVRAVSLDGAEAVRDLSRVPAHVTTQPRP